MSSGRMQGYMIRMVKKMTSSSSCRLANLISLTSIVVTLELSALQFSVVEGSTGNLGTWQLLLNNSGISSMHTAVTHYDTAIFLDRTDVGLSKINFSNGYCRNDPNDRSLKHDCSAHSVMFNPGNNTVRTLTILTDTWCSSGQFAADGTLVQTGGDYDGFNRIRRLTPCAPNGLCDWVQDNSVNLTDGRWYASNQILPDGRQIIVGGRATFTYEFVPKRTSTEGSFYLALLNQTNDNQHDNLYPYVHLLPSGNLFIFANRDSILLDYNKNVVVRKYPTIPGEPRNYPSAGSSVLLPLDQANEFSVAEVVVCGGAQFGAYRNPKAQYGASQTCGRIVATAANSTWSMETMPMRRTMGDMIILPTDDVLIINGAQNGSQGWGLASNPVFTPMTYASFGSPAARFTVLAATAIPRLYHSTANLLADGRVLVAGSNTHQFYTFSGLYPTELRVEAFSPPYLDASMNSIRPTITSAPSTIGYGTTFQVTFTASKRKNYIALRLMSAPFTTHSYSMGQRSLMLKVSNSNSVGGIKYTLNATAPPNSVIAPPGYYQLWPVQAGVPGNAVWVKLMW